MLVLGIVGTGVAYLLMGTLVGRVGPTRASFITYLIPVVSLVLGVVFQDDHVAALAVVGVGLVVTGAVLAGKQERSLTAGLGHVSPRADRRRAGSSRRLPVSLRVRRRQLARSEGDGGDDDEADEGAGAVGDALAHEVVADVGEADEGGAGLPGRAELRDAG